MLMLLLLLSLLPALLLVHSVSCAAVPVPIETWEFETDPNDVGVKEQWYSNGKKPSFAQTMTSPAVWQAKGVANYDGIAWYRKTITISPVPADGASVWLWIGGAPGGVLRSAHVWANGVHCGRHLGYVEPLEMDLTAAINGSGALTLAVALDSRWNQTEDPLWASGGLGTCFSFGGCGGMIGNAVVLVRQRAWIQDSVHITCSENAGSNNWLCVAEFSLVGDVRPTDHATLTVCESDTSSEVSTLQNPTEPVCTPPTSVAVGVRSKDARVRLSVTIPNAKLWVPGTRAAQADLYIANVTLTSSQEVVMDVRAPRFGVRSIEMKGPRIMFNGEPLFLRGYGDDAMYAFTGAPPMEKSYYMEQLRGMKALGYNFIRFHTHQMPDVFHEAADELGFLCDPEFPMCSVYPTPFGDTLNQAVIDTFNRTFTSIVHRRSHHPSVFGYVLSNEIQFTGTGAHQGTDTSSEFVNLYRFAKQHDPERPVWYSDGPTGVPGFNVSALSCRDGLDPTDEHCFMDVWVPDSVWSHTGGNSVPAIEGAVDMSSGVSVQELPVPMLLHEAMDARTFPRLEQNLHSFDGGKMVQSAGAVNPSAILTPSINKMQSLGFLQENDRWSAATEAAYTMFAKSYIENYRLDPAVSGYEWWLAYDNIGGSNGILGGHQNNPQMKPGISNSTFRSLQSETILLVETPVLLQTTGRHPGDFVPITVLLSNWTFMGFPSWHGKNIELLWSTSIGDSSGGGSNSTRKPLQNGTSNLDGVLVAQGEIGPIAVFGVDVPGVSAASKIRIEVTLQISGETIATNNWNIPVFPQLDAKQCSVQVFATSSTVLDAAQRVCFNAALAPPSMASQSKPFVLVLQGGLDAESADALSRTGGFALLLNPAETGSWPVCGRSMLGPLGQPSTVEYNQPWWMDPGMTGTLVYNTSFTQLLGFAVDDTFLDYSWATIVNTAQAYTLDTLAATADSVVHVRAIPASVVTKTGADFETSINNNALVWEGRMPTPAASSSANQSASAGRFLVSGFNIFAGASGEIAAPAADYMFAELLSYVVAETEKSRTSRRKSTIAQVGVGGGAVAAAMPVASAACNVSGSFCPAGMGQPCQVNATTPSLCNANFEIAVPVCLQKGAVLDALYAKLQPRTNGSRVVATVYETSSPAANASFCGGSDPTDRRLVAKGNATALKVGDAAWVQLPMPGVSLKAGIYWIGLLFELDTTCFIPAAPSPAPVLGPGAADVYAARPWGLGPGLGSELNWVAGSTGLAVYATTRP